MRKTKSGRITLSASKGEVALILGKKGETVFMDVMRPHELPEDSAQYALICAIVSMVNDLGLLGATLWMATMAKEFSNAKNERPEGVPL